MKTIVERAKNPNLSFGRGILAEASRAFGEYLLITQPQALRSAENLLVRKPAAVHLVSTMERAAIERESAALPAADTVVGLGGGMALDFAKFVAWRRGVEPVLVPGAASVDAAVCLAIAVREEARVRYVGEALARSIICDFDLMQSAPARLNRAGTGDILSIHTALFDWSLAAERKKAQFNPGIAAAAARLLDELERHAAEIRLASERGLRWLMEAFAAENRLCLEAGSSRPEEGSEHFFVYALERATGRSFIHGEAVCLGVLLLSRLQGNRVEWVRRVLEDTGVAFQPADLGLSKAELVEVFANLPGFVRKENLAYSVLDEQKPMDLDAWFDGLSF